MHHRLCVSVGIHQRSRTVWCLVLALLLPCLRVLASETDLVVGEEFLEPRSVELPVAESRKAEAMAWFARGIFEENEEGPDQALSSFEETLRRAPDYSLLAVQVSREYLQRGLIPEALGVLKDTAKARPKDFLPPLLIAEIYLRYLQKPALALDYARMAQSLEPLHFAPIGLLFEIYQYSGQRSRALRLLGQAAQAESHNPHYWLRLAGLHRGLAFDETAEGRGHRERFAKILGRAAELASDQPEILCALGDLCIEREDLNAARQYYEAAYALAPETPQLREQLAKTRLLGPEPATAEPLLWKLLEDNPHQLRVLDQLAALVQAREDWENLLLLRQRAVLLEPSSSERHLQVVHLLLQLNRPESAVEFARTARQYFPGQPTFTYLEAVCLTASKRSQEALPLFQQALSEGAVLGLATPEARFFFDYAVAAEQAGEDELTVELLQKSIRLAPSEAAAARNFLGYFWAERKKNLDEAEALIREALAAEPDNGAFLDSLGWVQFQRGKYADALILLLRAADALPEPDAVVFDHIAQTYLALGRSPEALLFWQKSLQLDPTNVQVQNRIEEITVRQARTLAPSLSGGAD